LQPTGELIDVGGRNLHYLKKGNGAPTVVFEAGLDMQGHIAWKDVQGDIAKQTTTISYDRAGILWSDRSKEPKTLSNMGADLLKLLEKTNCPKPYILVGHSFAGITLRQFIQDHKEDIQGLVFVDVSHPDQMNRMPDELKKMMKPPPQWVMKSINTFGINRMFINKANPNEKDTSVIIVNELMYKSMDGLMDEMQNIEVLANEASSITDFDSIPLVVVTGTHPDRNNMVPEGPLREEMGQMWNEMQKELLNLSTKSEHILAPKSGHYIQSDQPDLVVKAIQDLIEKNSDD
jgi:pimeloyl-ACP methyl ester carboxylesterase